MKVGITGTRYGTTPRQHASLLDWLAASSPLELHHGDCVGVDDEAAKMLYGIVRVISHPPIDSTHRAYSASDECRPCKTHFVRNRAIVDETDVLLVCPCQDQWQAKGGTWYTHDYAVKKGKRVIVIWPDGHSTDGPAPRIGGAK